MIDDALNLARVGLLKYELALSITSYLHKETEYIPWSAALTGLRYLDDMLERTAAYGKFKVRFSAVFRSFKYILVIQHHLNARKTGCA